MQLESLANELLLDLFEFLNSVELLLAFYGLNARLDNLLFVHFRMKPLDFRRVSKTDFNIVCQQHLPSIADRITSLYLFDDEETPQQTEYFFAHGLTLSQFINLQSLSLSEIDSEQTMDKMMNELHHMFHLQHLSIRKCNFLFSYIDSIWRLPKLIHCKLESIPHMNLSSFPTVTSFSLQHLSILKSTLTRFFFGRLLECTTCLRHLAADVIEDIPGQQLIFMTPSIETLTLSFKCRMHVLENLVSHMPNLSQLTVAALGPTYVNGYLWEKMITDHLPKLKVFRLLVEFNFHKNINGEEQVTQILDSFRTRFWIDEHQWFVRCHWKSNCTWEPYWLYTLPYAFCCLEHITDMQFKSTCSEEAACHSYDRIDDLHYDSSCSSEFLQLRFSKLQNLRLLSLIPDHFWSVVPKFDRLTSLVIDFSSDGYVPSLLQSLLDRAPRLYSLTVYRDSTLKVVNLTSKSIRRLDLEWFISSFNEQKCITLTRSSLGMQCEFLWAKVENPANIVYLVNNMKNLRALSCKCEDDRWYKTHIEGRAPLPKDELIEWLQEHLPPTCSILRKTDLLYNIHVWIR